MDTSQPVKPNPPQQEPIVPERTWSDFFRENKTIILIILVILAIAIWYFWSRGSSTSASVGDTGTVEVTNYRKST